MPRITRRLEDVPLKLHALSLYTMDCVTRCSRSVPLIKRRLHGLRYAASPVRVSILSASTPSALRHSLMLITTSGPWPLSVAHVMVRAARGGGRGVGWVTRWVPREGGWARMRSQWLN